MTRRLAPPVFRHIAILLAIFVTLLGLGAVSLAAPHSMPANTPPTADFTIDPAQGVVGTMFFFDALSSSDNEDSDAWLLARFDFDGDGQWDTSWLNPANSPYHYRYDAAGVYQVKLEVEDTGGLTDTKVKTLQVGDPGSNTPPTARCVVTPASGPPGTTFTFSAATSTDAQDAVSALKVKWDQWGGFDFRGQSWQPATQSVQFTYDTPGVHDVDLIIMDTGYLMDNTACEFEVVPAGGNTAPTADLLISPATGTITTTFTFDVRGSTDAQDDIASLSVQFDIGDDGHWDTGQLNASSTYAFVIDNRFGRVPVRARIYDLGGLSDDAVQTITVFTPYHIYLPTARK